MAASIPALFTAAGAKAAAPYVLAGVSAKTAMDASKQARASSAQQSQALQQQGATVERQQAQVQQQQSEMAQRSTAAIRARRGGGIRSLLSGERMTETGLPSVAKLGGD
jgi:hypothetical protein